MKHIFTLMTLIIIAKITKFGIRRTHMWLSKNKCIHNVSLFDADFGMAAYFFENEAGQVVTVTGALYRDMIAQFLELDDIVGANI